MRIVFVNHQFVSSIFLLQKRSQPFPLGSLSISRSRLTRRPHQHLSQRARNTEIRRAVLLPAHPVDARVPVAVARAVRVGRGVVHVPDLGAVGRGEEGVVRGAEVAVGRREDRAGLGPGVADQRVGAVGEGEEPELVGRRPAVGGGEDDVVGPAAGALEEVGAFVDGGTDSLPGEGISLGVEDKEDWRGRLLGRLTSPRLARR